MASSVRFVELQLWHLRVLRFLTRAGMMPVDVIVVMTLYTDLLGLGKVLDRRGVTYLVLCCVWRGYGPVCIVFVSCLCGVCVVFVVGWCLVLSVRVDSWWMIVDIWMCVVSSRPDSGPSPVCGASLMAYCFVECLLRLLILVFRTAFLLFDGIDCGGYGWLLL